MAEDYSWETFKNQHLIGQIVSGVVELHVPFGVFVDLGNGEFKGLINITEFKDMGIMETYLYPDLGSQIEAVVLAYNDKNKQIDLSMKPSVLEKARNA